MVYSTWVTLSQETLATAAVRNRHNPLRSQNQKHDFSVSFYLTELTKCEDSTNHTIQWSQTGCPQLLILRETP